MWRFLLSGDRSDLHRLKRRTEVMRRRQRDRPGRAALLAGMALLVIAGCGGGSARRPSGRARTARVETSARSEPIRTAPARAAHSTPQALVTAQTENQLLLVDVPSGRVLKRMTVAGDPEYVATSGKRGVLVVVSSGSGTVTLLDGDALRPSRVLGGFGSPHIPAISPDDTYAYVTDDSRGQVAAISLFHDKVVSRVSVGAGAHHLAFSPDEGQVWVALGQSARKIAILSTVIGRTTGSSPVGDPGHPRLVGRFDPGFLAHDLLFTPDGKRVWITSADTSDVGVFSARSHRLVFRVPGGPPPQHVAMYGRFAYITSGYGSRIEQVALSSGRVLARARAPYGSFELDAGAGYVLTSSLLRGTLAIYTPQLHLLHVSQLAPSTEDVLISRR